MKIMSWTKLVVSILISQSAGLIGTFFTISAIPSWYLFLNKPLFSPPNWLFGPVWTVLYTLIGISLYRIWIKNKKGSLNLFAFHLVLNALWSPIFFGLKNLGLAFFVILMMDISLVIIIKRFIKLDKLAAYLLIPYLLWISFATLLNLSIWKLNPQDTVKNIFAQDFTFTKARQDYIFTDDNYRKGLEDLNLKKASYQKNPTLSLKEEFRLSLYTFIGLRNNLVKNYLTMLRIKTVETPGIDSFQKELVYSKLDPEIAWYKVREDNGNASGSLEDLIEKSKEEDTKYTNETSPNVLFVLSTISLGEERGIKNRHIVLYEGLKKEAQDLIKLGRADASLFDRWFKDIDNELKTLSEVEKNTQDKIDKILESDMYERQGSYEDALEILETSRLNLLKLNGFTKELEAVISNKR